MISVSALQKKLHLVYQYMWGINWLPKTILSAMEKGIISPRKTILLYELREQL